MKKLLLILGLFATQAKGQDYNNAVYRIPRNYTDTQRVIYLVSDTTDGFNYDIPFMLKGFIVTIGTVEKANCMHMGDEQRTTELYYDERLKPLRKSIIVWQYKSIGK